MEYVTFTTETKINGLIVNGVIINSKDRLISKSKILHRSLRASLFYLNRNFWPEI